MKPIAIIGLGNPGNQYINTRHNAGYFLVNALCDKFRVSLRPGKGKFYYAKFRLRGEDCYLFRSTTYMNETGLAIRDIINNIGIKPGEIIAAYDDFALPLGTIRIRNKGSDGGHNGMNSIIYHTGTENIPRLRIGIGPIPDGQEVVDFVLNDFSHSENKIIDEAIKWAVEASVCSLTSGIQRAMSIYNRNIEKEKVQDKEPQTDGLTQQD